MINIKRKWVVIIIAITIVIACSILFLIFINNNEKNIEKQNNKYLVSFETNGGTIIDNIEINQNGKLEQPKIPTKEGYVFMGWYLGDEPFDFENIITENVTLIAKWEKENTELNNENNDSSENSVSDISKPNNDNNVSNVSKPNSDNNVGNAFKPSNDNNISGTSKPNNNTSINDNDVDNSKLNDDNIIRKDIIAPNNWYVEYSAKKELKIVIVDNLENSNVDSMKVYRSTSENGQYECIGSISNSGINVVDVNGELNKEYYYKLKPYKINDKHEVEYGEFSKTIKVPAHLSTPQNLYLTIMGPTIKVKYDEVVGATEYKLIAGDRIEKVTSLTSYEYQHGYVLNSTVYKVQAINKAADGTYIIYSEYSNNVTLPRDPFYELIVNTAKMSFSLPESGAFTKLTVSFDSVKNANGYEVYRGPKSNPYIGGPQAVTSSTNVQIDVPNKDTTVVTIKPFYEGSGYKFYGKEFSDKVCANIDKFC